MFCGNCGSPMEDTDKFCGNCGWRPGDAPSDDGANGANGTQTGETGAGKQTLDAAKEKGKAFGAKLLEKKLWIIGGVAVVAVAVVGVTCFARIGQFVRRTFSSPAKYYQYVEKTEAVESAAMVANLYDNLVRENLNVGNQSASGKVTLELSKDTQDMLESYADYDMSWLEKTELEYETTCKDDKFSVAASVGLKKGKVISGVAIADMGDETAYFQVPELNDQYIGIELVDAGFDADNYAELMSVMEQVYENAPNKKTVEKILYRYFCDAIESVDRVEKGKDVLEAEGVSKKYMTLTAKINGKTVSKMAEAVLTDMQKDKELKKIIEDMAPLLEDEFGYDGDVYEEFQDAVEDGLDELEYLEDMDNELKITVWVDSKGKIVGRRIKADGAKMLYAMPQKGSKFGFEASYEDDYDKVSLTGTGKRSGDKLSGDFKLKVSGMRVAEVTVKNYDTEALKSGYINGEFSIKPSDALLTEIGGSGAAFLSDMECRLNIKTEQNSLEAVCAVYADKDELGSLTITGKRGDGKKVSVPSGSQVMMIEDEDELIDWVEDIDWDKFLSKLRKAGAPSDLVDELEDLVDYL